MANYSLIDIPSQLILGQANLRMSLLLDDLANGTINSQLSLQGQALSIFNSFYSNLGIPLVTPMSFTGLPIAEQWNSYQRLLAADIEILYTQTRSINIAISKQLAFSTIENTMIAQAAQSITARVNAFAPTRPTRNGNVAWVVSNDFSNTIEVDIMNSTGINILQNTVELGRQGEVDQTSKVALSIDDTYISASLGILSVGPSNGFIGNTHETITPENTNTLTSSSTTNTISQAVQLNAPLGATIAFAGDGNLHTDITALTDGDPSTWLEYEVVNIPDILKANPCLGYGFDILVPQLKQVNLESIPWYAFHTASTSNVGFFPPLPTTSSLNPATSEISSNGSYLTASGASVISPLTGLSTLSLPSTATSNIGSIGAPQIGGNLILVINGVFKIPVHLTHISILPNILNNKVPIVKSVEVKSADTGIWISAVPISPAATSNLNQIWIIPDTLVSFTRIVIEQNQSYNTSVGHIVWVKQNSLNSSADPGILNALLGVGIHLDDSTQSTTSYYRVDGPNPTLSNIIANKNTVAQTIQGSSTSNDLIGPLIESFDGWRYAIALRSISFESISYISNGTISMNSIKVPIDIKSIQLDVHEEVPSNTKIQYEFSLDEGQTWNVISPLSHYNNIEARSYAVNPVSTSIGAIVSTRNYNALTNPTNSIRLRCILTGSSVDISISPRLHYYALKLEGITNGY